MPDNMEQVVSRTHVTGGGAGALGCFRYNPADGKIYIGLFGSGKSLRTYNPATNTSEVSVDEATLNGFSRASDMVGGWTDANDTGTSNPSGMMLNPAPVHLTWHNPQTGQDEQLVYPAGSLVYVMDGGTNVVDNVTGYRPEWTKKMWRWDLRKTWTPTSVAPDYDTARNGLGQLVGNYGVADWNDVFTVVFTEKDLHDVTGNAQTENLARQFTWSRDGTFIYFTDRLESDKQGGLWKLDPVTGVVQIIWRAPVVPAYPNAIAEPDVVHTSLHDFTKGAHTGEQVLFDGLVGDGTNAGSGNYGGISYVVDSGSAVHGPFALFTHAQFRRYAEWNGPGHPRSANAQGQDPGINPTGSSRVYSILVDEADGSVYFYDTEGGQNIWRYDAQGRFTGVKSKEQHILYNVALNSTSTSAISMRLQLRESSYSGSAGSFPVGQILFMASGTTTVGGVRLFKPGDFNRDNQFNEQDVSAFMDVLQQPIQTFRSGNTFFEAASDGLGNQLRATPAAYAEYLKYDLNNNGLVNGKDKLILWRLRGLAPVDYDADGDVDEDDRARLLSCMGKNTTYTIRRQLIGDVDGNGKLEMNDLKAFSGCASGPGIAYQVHGLPVGCTLTPDPDGLVAADLNGDGFIDQADFGLLQAAIGGDVGSRYEDLLCGDCDLDNDHDVDEDDLALFEQCFSGEGVPADPKCLD